MNQPALIDIPTWQSWQAAGRGAQLVDVRSATEFAAGHIPGAVNIPLEQIELRTADLAAGQPVVLVCQAGTRARLAAQLLAGVHPQLTVLDPGTAAWIGAGNPVVACTASRWALERQVRLIAGLLILAGIALALAVSPWFLALSAFVGCGLTFAGAFNLCLMGELLARLPWNRTRRSPNTENGVHPGVSCACEQQKSA